MTQLGPLIAANALRWHVMHVHSELLHTVDLIAARLVTPVAKTAIPDRQWGNTRPVVCNCGYSRARSLSKLECKSCSGRLVGEGFYPRPERAGAV